MNNTYTEEELYWKRGGSKFVITRCTVRENKTLFGNVDKIHVVRVDDETSSQTNEVAAFIA